ncbi:MULTISPECIES: HDOD domain-containing protein [unclassified Marinobacter]|uniref:HDOD domain-containing protein n=1 Tax=unclassified Marinobacter TaxID=83889 RepID=UPI0026E12F62|nr:MULTISPECIES: HDOD domain-containing protein [unclassified Marinobacter]MDO6442953.1 HDOD domain-containing protein [Marinobacter sp. 2_MG-2023]MDO6822833.1 HDOD domain-containing protein [Marinobacter sp. 1_MG-2023]
MPGFFSWIAGFFKTAEPPPSPMAEARLFNPAKTTEQGEVPENTQDLTLQLEENLFCWLLDTGPSNLHSESSSWDAVLQELQSRLTNNTMEEVPRRPMTLPMLMKALSDEGSDRHKLTQIILGDPALTDQILQVANSPYFRTGEHTIESVDQAVFVLGMNGIRNVISAAVMRPMMAARNSREALFAQRAWAWGLTCARAAEFIADIRNEDTGALFTAGLLPALSYITIRRELQRICKAQRGSDEPDTALIRNAISRYQWVACQLIASEWNLPPKYHAYLMAAERPAPDQEETTLIDGMVIGSREVLRHAHQRNLPEEDLNKIVHLTPEQTGRVRTALKALLNQGARG